VNPIGDTKDDSTLCETTVLCDLATGTVVQRFDAESVDDGVALRWTSGSVTQVASWNVYRGTTAQSAIERLNAAPIPMGGGGNFQFVDTSPIAGESFYRLAAVARDGSESTVETLRFTGGFVSRPLEFRLAGRNRSKAAPC
jgi:hypothetical protein